MKTKAIISIDYSAYYYFVMIVVFTLCTIMFSVFFVLGFETEKYSKEYIFVIDILFIILLLFSIIKLFLRIKLINKIIDHGYYTEVEIKDSVNWPRDQYGVFFEYNKNMCKGVLKVSKKNKSRLNELCKAGNRTKICYLNNKKMEFIFSDIYKEF